VVINKIDIALCWSRPGSDSQGGGRATPGKPIAYTNCKTGSGLDQVVNFILETVLFRGSLVEGSFAKVNRRMISDVKIDPGSLLEVTTPLKTADLYMRLLRSRWSVCRHSPVCQLPSGCLRLSVSITLTRTAPTSILGASPGLLAGG